MGLLSAEEIASGYGEEEILHGVSLAVSPREIVTVIGPNGAGKSTLLKTLAGLLKVRRGKVLFQGESIAGLPPPEITRRGICYVPQENNVFPSLSVTENLEMGAYVLPRGWQSRQKEVFARFPILQERRQLRAGALSGGERQMLSIGMALMVAPALLMLDEPSAGLAPNLVDLVFQKISDINQQGLAIVMVEQNAVESLKRSHRGYVLVMGRNRMEGPGSSLLEDPEIRESFLGG
jgi:branched-chain amino acid transport system ATP-binding protein